ncbi:hypothetical protein SLE2022_030590 [Rubroshorea leprosula]
MKAASPSTQCAASELAHASKFQLPGLGSHSVTPQICISFVIMITSTPCDEDSRIDQDRTTAKMEDRDGTLEVPSVVDDVPD